MKFKQIISLLMTAIILSTVVCLPTFAATDDKPDLLIGDADGDGEITIMDATAVALHLAKKVTLDELHQQTAKTDFSTEVLSVIDATIIQQKVADIDNKDTQEVGYTAFFYKNGEYVPALQEYQRYLDALVKLRGFNGVAYASRNGRVMCQSATGMHNPSEGTELTVDSMFAIGSVSKQFCATAVLMLQDQGKLNVNDTIEKYFPDYKYASKITIHNLLSMRSGILDYLNDNPEAINNIYIHDNAEDNEKEIINWAFAQELAFEPGELFWYSNTNYHILSLIVEQVSKMEYRDFIRTYILDELSMTNTGFYDELRRDERVAQCIVPEGIDPQYWPEDTAQGDGDIVTNAADIDKWLTAMADGVLLSSESHQLMTTNYNGYGYGIFVEKHNKYYHTGSMASYITVAMTYARDNINVFVVTNDDNNLYENDIDIQGMARQIATKIQ